MQRRENIHQQEGTNNNNTNGQQPAAAVLDILRIKSPPDENVVLPTVVASSSSSTAPSQQQQAAVHDILRIQSLQVQQDDKPPPRQQSVPSLVCQHGTEPPDENEQPLSALIQQMNFELGPGQVVEELLAASYARLDKAHEKIEIIHDNLDLIVDYCMQLVEERGVAQSEAGMVKQQLVAATTESRGVIALWKLNQLEKEKLQQSSDRAMAGLDREQAAHGVTKRELLRLTLQKVWTRCLVCYSKFKTSLLWRVAAQTVSCSPRQKVDRTWRTCERSSVISEQKKVTKTALCTSLTWTFSVKRHVRNCW